MIVFQKMRLSSSDKFKISLERNEEKMIVNVYLKVTQKQWEDIKEKYVEPNMYHIVSDSKRKHKRCDGCSAYNPCTTYEGYCTEVEGLVDRNSTCKSWH